MYTPLRHCVLALLKVPAEPKPPAGDPASLRVFHAGINYYRLRIGVWGIGQLLAFCGILFWTTILIGVETGVRERRVAAKPAAGTATSASPGAAAVAPKQSSSDSKETPPATSKKPRAQKLPERFAQGVQSIAASVDRYRRQNHQDFGMRQWLDTFRQAGIEIAVHLPDGIFPWIWALKIVTFLGYLIQIPLTYAARRLDYEMRWYMVTDRSLRLRHGVWKVAESTMSFANVQQVEVSQGPLQRLLGLANVKVKSAGGGSSPGKHEKAEEDMHLGVFHSVTHAEEIRDLILERLRRFRESGLGDPDEAQTIVSTFSSPLMTSSAQASGDSVFAAQELLAEARALRQALTKSTPR
jgi:membrane protein YdbS with pleckstrin-like domain